MLVDTDSPDDEEPMTEVQLMRKATKLRVDLGEGKCVLSDVRKGQVES